MLFHTIKHQPQGIEGLIATFLSSWQGTSTYFWIALLVLMVLNWTLESWKWRTLLQHIEPISIAQAFKSVLTGLALGMLLPSGTGDVAGRIINLKKNRGNRGRYCKWYYSNHCYFKFWLRRLGFYSTKILLEKYP
jgi:hypothetical protein